MKITYKREIYVERERRLTMRFGRAARQLNCAGCGGAAYFITVDQAALARCATAREIFRLAEAGRIHFTETEGGALLICFASLNSNESRENRPKRPNKGEL